MLTFEGSVPERTGSCARPISPGPGDPPEASAHLESRSAW